MACDTLADICLYVDEVSFTSIKVHLWEIEGTGINDQNITLYASDGTTVVEQKTTPSEGSTYVTFTGLTPNTTYKVVCDLYPSTLETVTTRTDNPKVATESQWEDLANRVNNAGVVPLVITVVPDPDAPGTIIPCTWSGATIAQIKTAYSLGRPIKVTGYRGTLTVIGIFDSENAGVTTTKLTALAKDIIVHFELLSATTGQILHDVLVDSDDIVDDLNTDDPFSPLSASQGVALKNMIQDLNAPERFFHYVQETSTASDVNVDISVDFDEYEKVVLDVEFLPTTNASTDWRYIYAFVNGAEATCYRSGHKFNGAEYERQYSMQTSGIVGMGVSPLTPTEAHLELDASAGNWPVFYGHSVGGPSSALCIHDVMGKVHHIATDVTMLRVVLGAPTSGAVVEAYGYKRVN